MSDPRGKLLGSALYSSSSQIAIRFVSFDQVELNYAFWLSRLVDAEKLRTQVVDGATAYRLVYGESDLLPSLIITKPPGPLTYFFMWRTPIISE